MTDALVDEWGEENVQAAFALSKHIKKNGLDGIEYMSKARGRLQSEKHLTVSKKMKSKMNGDY